jgi:hypothetical protein
MCERDLTPCSAAAGCWYSTGPVSTAGDQLFVRVQFGGPMGAHHVAAETIDEIKTSRQHDMGPFPYSRSSQG